MSYQTANTMRSLAVGSSRNNGDSLGESPLFPRAAGTILEPPHEDLCAIPNDVVHHLRASLSYKQAP